jgi:hypothetical protein
VFNVATRSSTTCLPVRSIAASSLDRASGSTRNGMAVAMYYDWSVPVSGRTGM